jgi:hypothetical protein
MLAHSFSRFLFLARFAFVCLVSDETDAVYSKIRV